jgi:hypothetical protein
VQMTGIMRRWAELGVEGARLRYCGALSLCHFTSTTRRLADAGMSTKSAKELVRFRT